MSKRGGTSINQKILNKQNKVHRVNISISIPQNLLSNIENHIKGENRSRKLVLCIQEGYRSLIQ